MLPLFLVRLQEYDYESGRVSHTTPLYREEASSSGLPSPSTVNFFMKYKYKYVQIQLEIQIQIQLQIQIKNTCKHDSFIQRGVIFRPISTKSTHSSQHCPKIKKKTQVKYKTGKSVWENIKRSQSLQLFRLTLENTENTESEISTPPSRLLKCANVCLEFFGQFPMLLKSRYILQLSSALAPSSQNIEE